MPYSYKNRRGKVHYFRSAETKRGNLRYYVTTSDNYPNLIENVPYGYEVAELPEDARVVIRKKKPIWITQEEKELVHDAIEEFSAFNDFFIHTEEEYIYVYHSQFNYVGGQEPSLNRAEAMECFGETIERWMRFLTALRFKLTNKEKRLFRAERVVFTGLYDHDFHPIGKVGKIEDLARDFGKHLGRESFFKIEPRFD
ncbi:MAG: hypothetical protein AAF740_06730 [Bacteroidota bacterium]